MFRGGRVRFAAGSRAAGRRWVLAVLVAAAAVGAGARSDLSLARKAALLDVDLAERFIPFGDGQVVPRRRLPTPERPYVTYNMSDTAYMSGIYCATQTWRQLVTGDPAAVRLAGAACAALGHLASVSGRLGLLARGSSPVAAPWFDDGVWRTSSDGRRRWRGNVSSDQVVGLMFGAFVHLAETDDRGARARLAPAVAAIVDAVLDGGRRIIGYDGAPTRWGHYEIDYVRDREPMNALLLLQMVKVAHFATGRPRFERAYRSLIAEGYARIGEGARIDEPPLRANHSDDVLIALALYPLLELERDPSIRAHYIEAARRWYRGGVHPGVDVETNPLAGFLWRHWTGESDGVAPGVETLRRMPLDMKWNRDTIEAYGARFGFSFEPGRAAVETASGRGPLPIDRRGRTWSFLVQNPYRPGVDRTARAPFETNGLDYLVSYWFGRAHGMIGPLQ